MLSAGPFQKKYISSSSRVNLEDLSKGDAMGKHTSVQGHTQGLLGTLLLAQGPSKALCMLGAAALLIASLSECFPKCTPVLVLNSQYLIPLPNLWLLLVTKEYCRNLQCLQTFKALEGEGLLQYLHNILEKGVFVSWKLVESFLCRRGRQEEGGP